MEIPFIKHFLLGQLAKKELTKLLGHKGQQPQQVKHGKELVS